MLELPSVPEIAEHNTNAKPENADIKPDLIKLKGSFSTCESVYQFEIRSDGTGEIVYSDFPTDREDFEHGIEVEEICRRIEEAVLEQVRLDSAPPLEASEIDAIRQEISSDILAEVFWEEINETLEDPFYRAFDDDHVWGEEFTCERGMAAELEEFLELCLLTERTISNPEDYLIMNSETECAPAELDDSSYYSERLAQLVEIACGYYRPTGHRYDYNDGLYDRYSGYSLESESLSISLTEAARAPAREKILGLVRLKEKLLAMEVSAEKIAELTTF